MNSSNVRDWQWVKSYCEDRLDEIRRINGFCNPFGFVCIAAFMGFLSRLAFGTNNKTKRLDGQYFRDFVRHFMPTKYHGQEDLMYRTFRCGIVHAMSFDDELGEDNVCFLQKQPQGVQGFSGLAITHNRRFDSLCSGNQLQREQNGMFVLVADVLCDDIEEAIGNMFADSNARGNCERFILCQRPITAVSPSKTREQQPGSEGLQSESCDSGLSASCSNFGSSRLRIL